AFELPAFRSLRPGVERYRTLALRAPPVAGSAAEQSGGAPAQDIRGAATWTRNHRMVAGKGNVEDGVERPGLSRSGNRRIDSASVPPARGRHARTASYGTDGEDPVRALELRYGRSRNRRVQRTRGLRGFRTEDLRENLADVTVWTRSITHVLP